MFYDGCFMMGGLCFMIVCCMFHDLCLFVCFMIVCFVLGDCMFCVVCFMMGVL